jgi:hypothetical protein
MLDLSCPLAGRPRSDVAEAVNGTRKLIVCDPSGMGEDSYRLAIWRESAL